MNLMNRAIPKLGSDKMFSCLMNIASVFCLLLFALLNSGSLKAQSNQSSAHSNILDFEVSTIEVKGESWQQISWSTSDVDGVKLFKDGKQIPGRVQLEDGSIGWPSSMAELKMKLKQDATFELIVENELGVISRKVVEFKMPAKNETKETGKLKVRHYPSIKEFYITPNKVKAGDSITFSWDVKDSSRIRLYDDVGEIDLRSEHKRNGGLTSAFSTTIDKTTRFKLVAMDGNKKPAVKAFTVEVEKPTNLSPCNVSGKLTGKWRQKVRETPKGPLSTWVVNLYIFEGNDKRPFAKGRVNKNGHYNINNLDRAKSYTIKPDWKSTPEKINFSCDSDQPQSNFNFNITGSPRLD